MPKKELPKSEQLFRRRYRKSPSFLSIHMGVRADVFGPVRPALVTFTSTSRDFYVGFEVAQLPVQSHGHAPQYLWAGEISIHSLRASSVLHLLSPCPVPLLLSFVSALLALDSITFHSQLCHRKKHLHPRYATAGHRGTPPLRRRTWLHQISVVDRADIGAAAWPHLWVHP